MRDDDGYAMRTTRERGSKSVVELLLLREERKNVRRNNEPKHYAYVNVRVPRANVNLNDQKSKIKIKGQYPISIFEKNKKKHP